MNLQIGPGAYAIGLDNTNNNNEKCKCRHSNSKTVAAAETIADNKNDSAIVSFAADDSQNVVTNDVFSLQALNESLGGGMISGGPTMVEINLRADKSLR